MDQAEEKYRVNGTPVASRRQWDDSRESCEFFSRRREILAKKG